MSSFAQIVLALFVIFHGIAFGAGVYEMRMVTSAWVESLLKGGNETHPDSGRKFWGFVTTGPLTLLTLASLFLAWKIPGAQGEWWRAAAWITLAERLLTFTYFIPTMVKLQGGRVAPDKTKAVAARWATVNYLRLALSLVAWLTALRAFGI